MMHSSSTYVVSNTSASEVEGGSVLEHQGALQVGRGSMRSSPCSDILACSLLSARAYTKLKMSAPNLQPCLPPNRDSRTDTLEPNWNQDPVCRAATNCATSGSAPSWSRKEPCRESSRASSIASSGKKPRALISSNIGPRTLPNTKDELSDDEIKCLGQI